MTERRLVVMRHAKAEPYATTDHARRLTDKGRMQAAAAGTHLRSLDLVPDHALVSTAERTRMTWAEIAGATGSAADAQMDAAVYAGGVDVALAALQATPAAARTVMFIGHNPTAAYVAHLLDDGDGDPEAVSGMLHGFPAGALVVFDVEVSWSELGDGAGRVVDFFAPE